jgi:hypothetical protein
MEASDAQLILHRLEDHSQQLDRIEAEAKKTNGRITRIELWKARMEGANWALSWVPSLGVGIAVGIAVGLLT